jgi:translocation and assembly module TamB
VATAHWDAPSKTRVFVDVSGTPKDLKLAFRSEPDQLSQDAILSLILFGDENGSPGASQSTASADDEDVNKAAGVAGGVVTQGLNKAISGVTDADITTRVDTSEAQNPRPELAVQVTKELSAAIAYNLGIPPPGQNPDRTEVILDYRFTRGWSLLTTLGDSGSSIVDLLWQYRY